MQLYQVSRDGETQSGPGISRPHFVNLIKAFEDTVDVRHVHPHAGVGDLDLDAWTGSLRAQRCASAWRRELDCIVREVHENLLQPLWIGSRRQKIRMHIDPEFHVAMPGQCRKAGSNIT